MQLEQFINKVPIGKKAVAVVERCVFQKDTSHDLKHVYAIYYEKKIEKDVFYLYDSLAESLVDVEAFSNRSYELYIPNQSRQSRLKADCHAYAIIDARLLKGMIEEENAIREDKSILMKSIGDISDLFVSNALSYLKSIPQLSFGKIGTFNLPSEFIGYDAHRFKQDLFIEIIERIATGGSCRDCEVYNDDNMLNIF